MPLKYIFISIIAHLGIFASAIYFHSIEEKKEAPKEKPIFFEVVEESHRREEVKEVKEEEKKILEEKKEIPIEKKRVLKAPPLDNDEQENKIIKIEKPKIKKETSKEKPIPPPPPKPETPPPPPPQIKKEALTVKEEKAEKPSIEKSKVISSSSPIGQITPIYPRSARRKGHEGEVVIEIEISENGDIVNLSIASSSGHDDLDNAAIKAVSKLKFNPAKEDGVNTKGKLRLPINFKLK
jgi:protein TonB